MVVARVRPGGASVGDSRAVRCQTCESFQSATVAGVVQWSGKDAQGDVVNPPAEYALAACDACGDAVLQSREDFGGWLDPTTVYPAPRVLAYGVPEELRREWVEATKCFDAGAFTAVVVMVRRTLEGTCNLHGVAGRDLSKSLTAMRERGVIDDTLAQWSSALRVLGNKGAHFGEHVDRQDAEDALHFAEAFLNHVYVLRARFEEFRGRVDRRSSS